MCSFFFFFFNDTATTEIYTLSLHDALPISVGGLGEALAGRQRGAEVGPPFDHARPVPAPHLVEEADLVEGTEPSLGARRSEEHTSELQSQSNLVCRLLLEKKKTSLATVNTHLFSSYDAVELIN